LGLALGLALKTAGHPIAIAVARTTKTAKPAGKRLNSQVAATGARELHKLPPAARNLIAQSPIVVIATPDDAIPHIAIELRNLLDNSSSNQRAAGRTVFHTSGALTSDVLDPLRRHGFSAASIHPLISISGGHLSNPFAGSHFALEGDREAVRIGRGLVREIGGNSFVIDAQHKALYHAAAVMASPNLTALIDIAVEMMTRCGLSPRRSRQILLPLIQSTVDNLVHQNPRSALTGTFKRGDLATVKMHLAAIASERLTDALRAYVTLGEHSLALSQIPKSKKRVIETLLNHATAKNLKR